VVRVVVVAHDDLASHFLKSAEELLGTMEGVYARDLTRRQSTGELVDELGKLVDLSGGDDVFFLIFLSERAAGVRSHGAAAKTVKSDQAIFSRARANISRTPTTFITSQPRGYLRFTGPLIIRTRQFLFRNSKARAEA